MLHEFVQEVRDTIDEHTRNMHTALPGKVVSYDTGTGLAIVLPTMMYKKPDGTTMAFPQVTGVPVVFPQVMNQKATIAFPVSPDDQGLLIISEQSLDYWLYGQETDTDLAFDLTNAIFIPGMFNVANPVMADAVNESAIILDREGTSRETVRTDYIRLDVSGNMITIYQDGLIQIDASSQVIVNAPLMTVNANMVVNGYVTVSDYVTAQGEVTGNGVQLSTHTHTDSEGGTTTSPN